MHVLSNIMRVHRCGVIPTPAEGNNVRNYLGNIVLTTAEVRLELLDC